MENRKFTPPRSRVTTINAATSERPLLIREARELLGIHTRKTINLHLKTLGLFGMSSLTWEDFKRLLALREWLRIRPGNRMFSRRKFVQCEQRGITPEQLLNHFGIDLNQKLQECQEAMTNYQLPVTNDQLRELHFNRSQARKKP
ncbi:MAG: hypothetical protein SAJ72_24595 [Jaaginema sp. PMC 1080.18]|nr:hypothetical protein [Jaaginema sp. PMC 1080.18]MEC4869189.1 hypothetical protein [Jaaginema sp. PMC 1078.18]